MPKPPNHFCVALLNEVADEDAIVVTALDALPFCCHADLCLMPREELQRVAYALNARLPAALRIDTRLPDRHIRGAIESLVGLRVVGSVNSDAAQTPLLNIRLGQSPPVQSALSEGSPLAEEHSERDAGSSELGSSQGTVIIRNISDSLFPPWTKTKRKTSPGILSFNWGPQHPNESSARGTSGVSSGKKRLSM